MTGAMQTFNNPLFGDLRMFMIDGAPWFVGKDVAGALGYGEPHKALQRHVDEDDGMKHPITDSIGREQTMTIINESGLYSLILSSKLPKAKEFKHWVTSEVLPSIRQTGSYSLVQEPERTEYERPVTRDDYIKAASIVGSCRNERLPIVVKLLEQAGLDVANMDTASPVRDIEGRAAMAIMDAQRHGYSLRQLDAILGINHNQLRRILIGESKPKIARANLICDTINDLLEAEKMG